MYVVSFVSSIIIDFDISYVLFLRFLRKEPETTEPCSNFVAVFTGTHLLLQGPVHDWPSSSEFLFSIVFNLAVSQGFVFILLIAIVVLAVDLP